MKLIKKESDYDFEKFIYETNDIKELKEYINKHLGTYDMTVETSIGDWDCLSDYYPEDILVENKIYHIIEYHCDRIFIDIKEVI